MGVHLPGDQKVADQPPPPGRPRTGRRRDGADVLHHLQPLGLLHNHRAQIINPRHAIEVEDPQLAALLFGRRRVGHRNQPPRPLHHKPAFTAEPRQRCVGIDLDHARIERAVHRRVAGLCRSAKALRRHGAGRGICDQAVDDLTRRGRRLLGHVLRHVVLGHLFDHGVARILRPPQTARPQGRREREAQRDRPRRNTASGAAGQPAEATLRKRGTLQHGDFSVPQRGVGRGAVLGTVQAAAVTGPSPGRAPATAARRSHASRSRGQDPGPPSTHGGRFSTGAPHPPRPSAR